MLKWLMSRRNLIKEVGAERYLRQRAEAECERAEAREEHLKGENSKLLDAVEYTPTEREFALAEEVKDLRSRAATPKDVDFLIEAAQVAYDLTGKLPNLINSPEGMVDTREVRSLLSDALGKITLPLVDQATDEEQEAWEGSVAERQLRCADPVPVEERGFHLAATDQPATEITITIK